jgi:hypothetical protein
VAVVLQGAVEVLKAVWWMVVAGVRRRRRKLLRREEEEKEEEEETRWGEETRLSEARPLPAGVRP